MVGGAGGGGEKYLGRPHDNGFFLRTCGRGVWGEGRGGEVIVGEGGAMQGGGGEKGACVAPTVCPPLSVRQIAFLRADNGLKLKCEISPSVCTYDYHFLPV